MSLSDKRSYAFFIKFLVGFFILYFFFPFYRGVTGPGGKMYSPFLDDHFNIIRGLTSFLTGTVRIFLEALNYHVYQKSFDTIRIDHSPAISVNPSCLGWGVMSFWIAFVFANAGRWPHKLKWMSIGIGSICILNITRITLITLALHFRWGTVTSLDHHQTFNIFSYGCILALMYGYTRVQKKYEEKEHTPKQKTNILPILDNEKKYNKKFF